MEMRSTSPRAGESIRTSVRGAGCDPLFNEVLASLPPLTFDAIVQSLKPVPLVRGDRLNGAGDHRAAAFFPTTAVVSILYLTADGASTEVAMVGREGIVSTDLLPGERGGATAIVQGSGMAYRLDASVLRRALLDGGALHSALFDDRLRLMSQIAVTAAGSQLSSIEQRLCRWLMGRLSRSLSNQLSVTHETISDLLGVRRESITAALGKLRNSGVIECGRGKITVQHPRVLEKLAGEWFDQGKALPRSQRHDVGLAVKTGEVGASEPCPQAGQQLDAEDLLAVAGQCWCRKNSLLAALPAAEFGLLANHLECVLLAAGQVLSVAGTRSTRIYFPATAVVSLLHLMADGTKMEVAMTGHEGLVGIDGLTNACLPLNAVVQCAGSAFSLDTLVLKEAVSLGGMLAKLVFRYCTDLTAQIALTAVGNQHSTVEQKLSRWLLDRLDRSPTDELRVTHDLIADLLGVRREAITAAARRLQDAGVIRYSRGVMWVINRSALVQHAGETYRPSGPERARPAGIYGLTSH